MTDISFEDIRRKCIEHFDTGEIACGGIPCDDAEFYNCVTETIEENGYAYITRKWTIGRTTRYDTFITDHCVGVRGTVFFSYKGEEIYSYTGSDRNVEIYFDEQQTEYHFETFQGKNQFTKEQLSEMIEIVKRENYNDLLRCFGQGGQMEEFATQMDMSFETRKLFYICVLEKLHERYVKIHGFENPIYNQKIDLIKNNDEVYFGKKCKQKWLNEENYVIETIGE